MSKSILVLDEINLLLNSEEPKNTEIYGNLYNVLLQIKTLKAVTMEELIKCQLDELGRAAITFNKKTLMDTVKGEWYVESDSSEDINKKVRCGLCNTPNKYLFFIRNRLNNTRLNVGSFCMTKFPGIEGYTEYKYHLNKTIRNQKVIARRTEFHNHFPNVINILDSASFYFDNLPILLPYNLYHEMDDTITKLRLIYSQYVNSGKKPENEDNPFESFSCYVNNFYQLKKKAEVFISQNVNNKFACKRNEIDWMLQNKQIKLLDEIGQNQGLYTQTTLSKIVSNDFVIKNFKMFYNCNESAIVNLYEPKDKNSQFGFTIDKNGYLFSYIIDIKKFMAQIGSYCFFVSDFKYNENSLFKVSKITYTDSNLLNATESIRELLIKFGFLLLFDDNTNDIYIYKKADKSVKIYSAIQFMKTYSLYFIEKSMDKYKFISILTTKNWVSPEAQGKQGIDDKINSLYYHQYIEPYL